MKANKRKEILGFLSFLYNIIFEAGGGDEANILELFYVDKN